jgi:hypothetical protein
VRRFSIVILIYFCFTSCFGQSVSSQSCSEVINRLSSEWKLDSKGNSGFRLNNCRYILSCKQGNFTKEFLLEKFGKPNEMRKISGGTECLYYYYDFKTLPKNKTGPRARAYVNFTFKDADNFIYSISD